MITKRLAYGLLLILNVLVVYSNHFGNDFQYDDTNAIPNNPAIRRPGTIVKAFVDPTLFSSAPGQRTYRPVTTASLALDRWLAGGLNVFFFHLSTFFWYSVQLVLMFLLFERLMDMTDPHPANFWTALAVAAAFGLHPANAETVNYIIQRGDLYNALGCIAALWLFVRYPSQRKFGWYLLPAALAMLAKAPALVFPLLLLAYVLVFEQEGRTAGRRWKSAMVAALPATAVAGAAALLLRRMQPNTWAPGAMSPSLYRLTQPFVALHYFKSFFLPTGLNIDPGWRYVAPFSVQALAGYVFVLLLLAIAFTASRKRCGRPVTFGIIWFFVTLLPTSLMPLGDVTNDHRMFFCFVGLALAVFWSLRLALFGVTARLTTRPGLVYGSVAALALLLAAAGVGTRVRNRVWLTKESLWSDSVSKNPRNPRALSNFGAVAYEQADYQTALESWQRAVELDSTVVSYQTNLIRAAIKLHRDDLTEICFRRIVTTYPSVPGGYTAYADWLAGVGRFDEAIPLLDRAQQLDPKSEDIKNIRARLIARRDAANQSALFRALDVDHDNRLSTEEMIAAPAVLSSLDKNGDGKLTAEECGTTSELMRSDPLLRALDANHDGQISASEIHDAERELEKLEQDHNGVLEGRELIPDYVAAAALRVFARLDLDHDGRIEANEWAGAAGDPFRSLLRAADADRDSDVTLEELTAEIFRRADQNRDGIVTREEMDAAIRSGALGPFFRAGGS
jgi:protein O-mannosyl-transferase